MSKRKTLQGTYQKSNFFVWIIYFIQKPGVSYRHPICNIFVVVPDLLLVISGWQIYRKDLYKPDSNQTD